MLPIVASECVGDLIFPLPTQTHFLQAYFIKCQTIKINLCVPQPVKILTAGKRMWKKCTCPLKVLKPALVFYLVTFLSRCFWVLITIRQSIWCPVWSAAAFVSSKCYPDSQWSLGSPLPSLNLATAPHLPQLPPSQTHTNSVRTNTYTLYRGKKLC